MTEKSLMDRLSTDMHEACLKIEKGCRSEKINTFIRQTTSTLFLVEIIFLCLK